nr:3-ketoacyl-CoA thiolase 2, peroxisomal [Tanacetum cinerariifolium]
MKLEISLLDQFWNQAPQEKVNAECSAFYTGFAARVVNTQYYPGLHAITDVAATIKARFYDIGIGVDF